MRTAFHFAIRLCVGAALLVLALTPESLWSGAPTICVYRNLLGAACGGCGMTRALSAALHGNWHAALAQNGGVLIGLPVLAMLFFCPRLCDRLLIR